MKEEETRGLSGTRDNGNRQHLEEWSKAVMVSFIRASGPEP